MWNFRRGVFKSVEPQSAELEVEEDYALIYKPILSKAEKDFALARTGCSELIIICQSIFYLEKQFRPFFSSVLNGNRAAYKLSRICGDGGNISFGCFCAGIYQAYLVVAEGWQQDKGRTQFSSSELKGALKECKGVFNNMKEMVAQDQPALYPLVCPLLEPKAPIIKAWSSYCYIRQQLTVHDISDPFSYISGVNGDVQTAWDALAVLEYAVAEYPDLRCLIEAALPLLREKIREEAAKSAIKEEPSIDQVERGLEKLFAE